MVTVTHNPIPSPPGPNLELRREPWGCPPSSGVTYWWGYRCMQSPAQVIIHALWYIVVLTGDQGFKGESRDVTETPAFHLLHYKGSSCAEDFMLRTFIICAMVADKWVNDHPFPLKVWARVTQLPAAILAAMESCVLQGLRWNVHMTPTQWKNMLKFLRSSEPSYIELNPSTITSTLSSTIVVRILDKLTRLADAMETSNSQSAYNYDDCREQCA
ncbi:hypothetical protein EDC04DRAFT_586588 [Pisolithus marmoratus]|nr:hypothetical protein EDC04DRAFT_586588 [Pisolithus marmoratus]